MGLSKMTTLEEKETKIIKFNFLVKITLMMEMLNDKSASTPKELVLFLMTTYDYLFIYLFIFLIYNDSLLRA
jgi:hypothetical protein